MTTKATPATSSKSHPTNAGSGTVLDKSLTDPIQANLKSKGIAMGTFRVLVKKDQGPVPSLQDLTTWVKQQMEKPDAQMTALLNPAQWPAGVTPNIPFDYIPDGCYARAQMMIARIMKEQFPGQTYTGAKIFMMGDLSARNDSYFPQGVRWGWHVVPLVKVTDGNTTRLVAVDPSLDPNNPVMSPEDWAAKIDHSSPTDPAFASTPPNIDLVDDTVYYPLNGAAEPKQTFDKNTPSAIQTCISYTQALLAMGKATPATAFAPPATAAMAAATATAAEPPLATHHKVSSALATVDPKTNVVHLHNSPTLAKATPAQAATLAKLKGKPVHVWVSHQINPATGYHDIAKIAPAS